MPAQVRLGRVLAGLKRYDDAEKQLTEGYATLRKHARSPVPEVQAARQALFAIYSERNDTAKAALYRD